GIEALPVLQRLDLVPGELPLLARESGPVLHAVVDHGLHPREGRRRIGRREHRVGGTAEREVWHRALALDPGPTAQPARQFGILGRAAHEALDGFAAELGRRVTDERNKGFVLAMYGNGLSHPAGELCTPGNGSAVRLAAVLDDLYQV